MECILDSDLQYIIDKMENILNNMQRNITSYNEQKTKLYWSHVKMTNNVQIWGSDIKAIENLNDLLKNMLLYTEKIMQLAQDILDSVKKLKQDMEKGNIENQQEYIQAIEQKVGVLSVFYKDYNEEQVKYVKCITDVKELLDSKRLDNEQRVQNISFWQKLKNSVMSK